MRSTANDEPAADIQATLDSRLLRATERAQRLLAQTPANPNTNGLVRAAQRAPTVEQRVVWLRRAASAWALPMLQHAACATGCDHCCHIAVTLSDIEARVIGKAIGRSVRVPDDAPTIVETENGAHVPGTPAPSAGYSDPCPFLQNHRCSIYEARPLACRAHLNLDQDDYLCRLRPDLDISVPYANATAIKSLYVAAQPNARWADIRAFFPAHNRTEPQA